ncbi:MAG: hypothetical protein Q9168_002660 [Polycauliona sp. 1 TL-2023]
MTESYYRQREKKNALEWQVKAKPGVHQGNTINSYFNQDIDQAHESDSHNEDHLSPTATPKPRPTQGAASKNPPRRHQPITLSAKKDNAAKVAFRNNKPPDRTFDLAKPIKDIEPDIGSLSRAFEQIGMRAGSFILPQRSLNNSTILIWGNPKQIDISVTELRAWQSQARGRAASKALAKNNFAESKSFIGYHYAADERTARRDATRQEYQKAPLQDQKFKYNGHYLWPNDEIRATDLFGPSCEALDSLRMEYKVHITFDEARSAFRIFSNSSIEIIYTVIQRIENTMKEFVARDDRPLVLYLIDPASTGNHDNVQIIPGPVLGPSQTASKIPESCGNRLDPIVDLESEAKKSIRNQVRMSAALGRVLEKIPYIRGHLRMRAQFGTFALVKFQWPPGVPSIPLANFETNVQSAGTRDHLFQAIGISDDSLAIIPPQYTAMFYLRHPEKAEEMIQLEVDLKANTASGGFEPSKAFWKKGPKPDGVPQAAPLEIFNVRLHSRISWQLKISADNLVDPSRITPGMETFAAGVVFKKPPPGTDTNPAVSGYKIFTSPANFAVLGTEQKTTFRYSLKAQPKFVVEISRYDAYDGDTLPSATQWAVSLYDREWDSKLSENARLGVGCFASWKSRREPFFEPVKSLANSDADAGFKDFLLHTQAIGNFLDGLKAELQEPAEAAQ